jgi:hypothetical protein
MSRLKKISAGIWKACTKGRSREIKPYTCKQKREGVGREIERNSGVNIYFRGLDIFHFTF